MKFSDELTTNLSGFMGKLFQIEFTTTISAWIFPYHSGLIHLVDCTASAANGN